MAAGSAREFTASISPPGPIGRNRTSLQPVAVGLGYANPMRPCHLLVLVIKSRIRRPDRVLIAAVLCLLVTACGRSGHGTTASEAGRRQTASAPTVSANPYLRHIDSLCAHVMPGIRPGVQDAERVANGSASSADQAAVGQSIQTVLTLNSASQELVIQYNLQAGANGAPAGRWHATDRMFLAALQYFSNPASGPISPADAARQVVQEAHRGVIVKCCVSGNEE